LASTRKVAAKGLCLNSFRMLKFVAHGRRVISLAIANGWRPGARYTNLRDVRHVPFSGVGFLDIQWKRYCFETHLAAAQQTRPFVTVARDIECATELGAILLEAAKLSSYAEHVIVVPKDKRLEDRLEAAIPSDFMLGFSVPTRYGGTTISPAAFCRPVHLLGGRPDVQRRLAEQMPVVSFDCNRFTLDARFGDYFDGTTFRPHPAGGYEACLLASIHSIDQIWADYLPSCTL
jgi:hypothetical protein